MGRGGYLALACAGSGRWRKQDPRPKEEKYRETASWRFRYGRRRWPKRFPQSEGCQHTLERSVAHGERLPRWPQQTRARRRAMGRHVKPPSELELRSRERAQKVVEGSRCSKNKPSPAIGENPAVS